MGRQRPSLDDRFHSLNCHTTLKASALETEMCLDIHLVRQLYIFRALILQHRQSFRLYQRQGTFDHQRKTLPQLCVFARRLRPLATVSFFVALCAQHHGLLYFVHRRVALKLEQFQDRLLRYRRLSPDALALTLIIPVNL